MIRIITGVVGAFHPLSPLKSQKYLIKAEEKGQTIHKIGVEFSYNKDQRNIIEWVEV